ncbi:hypothetical protein [Chitinibacter tainanensis]|uniref:hypothetical protein n=1 Tax=Chitinibacter tainanensis TaxID=230667 RepID=UPI000409B6E2|nr:hypothetical protein [Chitinibacter tainanensis]
MQTTIAQMIALTSWGNALLQGRIAQSSDFYPGNSTFQFCAEVAFYALDPATGSWPSQPLARDPLAWLQQQADAGVEKFSLSYWPSGHTAEHTTSDRMAVGFVGGGGRWLLLAHFADGVDVWEARWEVGERQRADRKIWQVRYGQIARRVSAPASEVLALPKLRALLANQLTALTTFASEQKELGFAKTFARALDDLNTAAARLESSDLTPPGALNLSAQQLLAATETAWVFGGMGSWNDVGFAGAEYDSYSQLSDELFVLLTQALVLVANHNADFPRKAQKAWWQFWKSAAPTPA